MSLLTAVLLMTACRGGENDGPVDEECYLTIYVYAPGNPIATRSEVYQDAKQGEDAIHTLQMWVFRHSNGELLGYMEDYDVILGSNTTYKIAVAPSFADEDANTRNVDVYAVANVTTANSGYNFNRLTARADLDAAVLQGDFFGAKADDQSVVRPVVQTVPPDGLPMTAVLKDKAVEGTFPALRIVDSPTNMATLKLARAVSKLRFVLSRAHDANDPNNQLFEITDISLNTEQIASQSYLMLKDEYDNRLNLTGETDLLSNRRLNIGTSPTYLAPEIHFGGVAAADIPIRIDDDQTTDVESVTDWVYDAQRYAVQTGESYGSPLEKYYATIDAAIAAYDRNNLAAGQLLEFGRTYLRETDKKISGTITYKVGDSNSNVSHDATFELSRRGDFTRNHSWTILVLYDGQQLLLKVVDIGIRQWIVAPTNNKKEVYNW